MKAGLRRGREQAVSQSLTRGGYQRDRYHTDGRDVTGSLGRSYLKRRRPVVLLAGTGQLVGTIAHADGNKQHASGEIGGSRLICR